MYKYEKDPTRTVGATERTRDVGRTDGQTETNIPPPPPPPPPHPTPPHPPPPPTPPHPQLPHLFVRGV